MRNLLISYVCNDNNGIMFGNIIRNFDEMPSVTEIREIVELNYPDTTNFTLMNLVELSEQDFKALNKDIPYER